jgi:hypothetical protein
VGCPPQDLPELADVSGPIVFVELLAFRSGQFVWSPFFAQFFQRILQNHVDVFPSVTQRGHDDP